MLAQWAPIEHGPTLSQSGAARARRKPVCYASCREKACLLPRYSMQWRVGVPWLAHQSAAVHRGRRPSRLRSGLPYGTNGLQSETGVPTGNTEASRSSLCCVFPWWPVGHQGTLKTQHIHISLLWDRPPYCLASTGPRFKIPLREVAVVPTGYAVCTLRPVARSRVRTGERRPLVGGRGWHVRARPCNEGEGRLACAVGFCRERTDSNQSGAARARRKRACFASS